MKFTIIHGSAAELDRWEEGRMAQAAEAAGWNFETARVTNLDEMEAILPRLGDVVYYRGTDLHGVEKASAKEIMGAGRILVNRILAEQPFLVYKSHQQLLVRRRTKVAAIPTWRFKNKEEVQAAVAGGCLTLPFIQKPEIGSRGVGVKLVRGVAEVDEARIRRSAFQPYVPNDGDLRVMAVGGEVVGVVKRTAAPGKVVNNLSQGATGMTVENPALLAKVKEAAGEILRALPYDVAGIDLIEEQGSGRLIFLEINSVPRWEHFERITGIDVARAIVKMAQETVKRQAVCLTV